MPGYHIWQMTTNPAVFYLKATVMAASTPTSPPAKRRAARDASRAAHYHAKKLAQAKGRKTMVRKCRGTGCPLCEKGVAMSESEAVVGTPEWEARRARIDAVRAAFTRAQGIISEVINPTGGNEPDFITADVKSAIAGLDNALEWLDEY